MHVVILAGGKGVRLRPYTSALPKPLVPIGEEYAILDIILQQLTHQGFTHATLAVGHLGPLIRAFVGDGSRWGLAVDYTEEVAPLSTIGPLFPIRDRLPEHFLVMNGDVLTDLDYADLLARHVSSDAPLTVATSPRVVKIDFGVLEASGGRIIGFRRSPARLPGQHGRLRLSRDTIASYPRGCRSASTSWSSTCSPRTAAGRLRASTATGSTSAGPDDYDEANAASTRSGPSCRRRGAGAMSGVVLFGHGLPRPPGPGPAGDDPGVQAASAPAGRELDLLAATPDDAARLLARPAHCGAQLRAGCRAAYDELLRGNAIATAVLVEAIVAAVPRPGRPAGLGRRVPAPPSTATRARTGPGRPVGAYGMSHLAGTSWSSSRAGRQAGRGVPADPQTGRPGTSGESVLGRAGGVETGRWRAAPRTSSWAARRLPRLSWTCGNVAGAVARAAFVPELT